MRPLTIIDVPISGKNRHGDNFWHRLSHTLDDCTPENGAVRECGIGMSVDPDYYG